MDFLQLLHGQYDEYGPVFDKLYLAYWPLGNSMNEGRKEKILHKGIQAVIYTPSEKF